MTSPAKLKCPTCQTGLVWSDAYPARPFCSQRCKDIDFGAWASDAYRVEGAPPASPDDASSFDYDASPEQTNQRA
jgi:uncharacterized protein